MRAGFLVQEVGSPISVNQSADQSKLRISHCAMDPAHLPLLAGSMVGGTQIERLLLAYSASRL